jgi:hypothetical protein
MGLIVGLTTVNPATSSNDAIVAGIVAARRIQFYKSTDWLFAEVPISYYFASSVPYPGVDSPRNIAAGNQYSSLILPSTSAYTNIRIRRGVVAVSGKLRWDVMFYYNNFLVHWGTITESFRPVSELECNEGGYLVLCNDALNAYEGGSGSLSVNYARFVTGTTTPMW